MNEGGQPPIFDAEWPRHYFTSGEQTSWSAKLAIAESTADGYCNDPMQVLSAQQDTGADLIISNLQLDPKVPIQGNSVDVTVEVTNRGNQDIDNTFEVAWFASQNLNNPSCTRNVDSLASGSSMSVTCTYNGYASSADSLTTTARADSNNTVPEVFEANNDASEDIAVTEGTEPDLVVSSLTLNPPSVSLNQQTRVEMTVTNQGTGI